MTTGGDQALLKPRYVVIKLGMDRLQKTLLISLVSVSAATWIASQVFQASMMSAMMAPYSALSISLFVAVWTTGMAAMMFPAISPVVLLYNRLVKNSNTALVVEGGSYSLKMLLFVGCYLAVWALTGLALLLGWSMLLNGVVAATGLSAAVYGSILIIAGAYQFSPLKAKCLGYCESPMGFFMRRWRNGTAGAVAMGTYHGLYCLGCCWPYFLLMVALGWMDILWMALFAGIIFGEKMWPRGIWIARAAGVGLAVVGILAMLGIVDISGQGAMMDQEMPAMQEPSPVEQMDSMQEPAEDQMSDDGMGM
jgi:predicted metal-binding membrane protein